MLTPGNGPFSRSFRLYLPFLTTLLFVLLYGYATTLYPGGSQHDLHAPGFSWVHNYWCNLWNTEVMNGQPNPARPFAIAAMFLLCAGLSFFWYDFPRRFPIGKTGDFITRITGITAMLFALLIFTPLHDALIYVSSGFGAVAFCGLFVGLYRNKAWPFFYGGLVCTALICVNHYIYYTKSGLFALPLIQKITFAIVLGWVLWMQRAFVAND